MSKPSVFISSTNDLKSARDLAAKVLISIGYDPIWQDIEATKSGELLQELRNRIKPCTIVVQLVGHRYGAEPKRPPEGMDRCSYAQYEALYAESIGKKVFYIWLPETFPVDHIKPETTEFSELQKLYRHGLKGRNILRHEATSHESLEIRILRLRDDLDTYRRTAGRRYRYLIWTASFGLVAIISIFILIALQWKAVQEVTNEPSWIDQALKEVGVDPLSITVNDFQISFRPYSLGPNQGRVDIKPDERLEAVVANGALEVRAGTGSWKMVYVDTMTGGYYAILNRKDLEAGAPFKIRLDSQPGLGVEDPIGPFIYNLDAGNIIRDMQVASLRDDKNWLSRRGTRWVADSKFFQDNADLIEAILIGETPETLTFQKELPVLPDLDSSIKESIEYSVLVNSFANTLILELERFTNLNSLYARLKLANGTLSPTIKFTTDPTSAIGKLNSSPKNMKFDGSPKSAMAILQHKEFKIGSFSPGTVRLRPLTRIHTAINQIRLRHNKQEPTRSISVISSDEIDTEENLFTISFPPDLSSRYNSDKIEVPWYWDEILVEVVLKDGKTFESSLKHNHRSNAVGFRATPTGKLANTAPPLYVIFERNSFSLFPWHDQTLGHASWEKLDISHPEDTVQLLFKSGEDGNDVEFSYQMDKLISIEEYLPFSVHTIRIDPTIVYKGRTPANSVNVSQSGNRLLVGLSGGTLLVYDRENIQQIATINAGAEAGYLSPNGLRIVANYHRKKSIERGRRGAGSWGLFDATTGKFIADLEYPSGRQHEGGRRPEFTAGGKFICFRKVPISSPLSVGKNAYAPVATRMSTELWSLNDGNFVSDSNDLTGYILGTLASDSKAIILSKDRLTLRVIDLTTTPPEVEREYTLEKKASSIALSFDGKLVAVHVGDDIVVLQSPGFTELYRVFSESDSRRNIPEFTDDGKALLIHPRLSDREYELIEASTGSPLFQFGRSQCHFVSKYVCWEGRGLGYTITLYTVPLKKKIDYLPFDAHYGYWSNNSFSLAKDNFMLWINSSMIGRDSQGLYFIDLDQSVTKQLMVPPLMSHQKFVTPDEANFIASTRSDGAVVLWETR